MAMEVDIAIVGGGLGGLALALGLQERGIKAHVFEKAPKVRVRSGTSVSFSLNGLSALEGIKPGLKKTLATKCAQITKSTAIILRQGELERVNRTYPAGALCALPWRTAHEILVDEILDQSLLHWRHAFLSYNVIEGRVEVRFEELPEKESVDLSPVHTKVVRAKLLVGADGLWSPVRKVLVGDELRYLSLITWNALVPTVSSLKMHEECEIRHFHYTNGDQDSNLRVFKSGYMLDAGSKLSLWQIRSLDLSGDIMKLYPLDLEAHGRDVRKARALREAEGMEWLENLRENIEATNPDEVREARQFDRLPLTSWSDSSKCVVLLGDAAHGMYPGPGQGAQQAFEDAHQLSLLLHEALCSSAPETAIPEAVTRYEEVRIPRANKVQAFAVGQTGLPEFIPEWVRNLPPEEQRKRSLEFMKWVSQYPENMLGDPNSTYWKP